MKAPWHDRTGLAKLLAIFLTALGVGWGFAASRLWALPYGPAPGLKMPWWWPSLRRELSRSALPDW